MPERGGDYLSASRGGAIRRPRVGLDLHVVDGIYQGSRTHCLELFSRVIAATPECDFLVLVADRQRLVDFSGSFGRRNVTLIEMPTVPPAVRLLWQLPRLAKKHRIDLLHMQYVTPPLSPCATMVTVHDILFESHPEYFGKLFVLRSRLSVRPSVGRSVGVFTVSQFSRGQIAKTFGTPREKVHVIPNGVDCDRFFPGSEGKEVAEDRGLKTGTYFLTVGRLEPRKNHAALLRAWARLCKPRPRLVIVGQRHFGYNGTLELRRALGLEEDVLFLEDVSDKQLPAVYRNAKAFVYCSWAEGFGMPVLEAMASGIPVISSATTALSEICADAALLVHPGRIDEISDAVCRLDCELGMRRDLSFRGLRRVADFNWDTSADVVRCAYLRYFGLQVNECGLPS